MSSPLLRVRDLKTHFRIPSGGLFKSAGRLIKAVDGVSFDIREGEVLGLVGESGCGKSTIGRTLTRLVTSVGGTVTFDGKDILSISRNRFRPLRRDIQMVFQDPYASLNPRLRVEQMLAEPLRIHGLATRQESAREIIADALERVGMEANSMKRYPHELSGGQRQRICIARVMILSPRLVIADEPVSALDASIQAQILNLIKKLQRDANVALLFISHDLGVVRYICDRIAVMYEGRIIETGSRREIFENPGHEYTRRLLDSIPKIPDSAFRTRSLLQTSLRTNYVNQTGSENS